MRCLVLCVHIYLAINGVEDSIILVIFKDCQRKTQKKKKKTTKKFLRNFRSDTILANRWDGPGR